ncbi:MAG: hypothetical protein ABIA59_02700, partial [Candidatus Latescibacterota bacterium]
MTMLLIGAFVALFVLSIGSSVANWDVEIRVIDLHVTKDTDGGFRGDPDPYIKIFLHRPEHGHGGLFGFGKSKTIKEQAVCTRPHKGTGFTVVHYDPISIEWYVMDDDPWGVDETMTKGNAGLVPGAAPKTVKSKGPAADIELRITQTPSQCGSNKTIRWRDLPDLLSLEYKAFLQKG